MKRMYVRHPLRLFPRLTKQAAHDLQYLHDVLLTVKRSVAPRLPSYIGSARAFA